MKNTSEKITRRNNKKIYAKIENIIFIKSREHKKGKILTNVYSEKIIKKYKK